MDTNCKMLLSINLIFGRLVGHHLGWVAFEIDASWYVCLSVHVSMNILVSGLEDASVDQFETQQGCSLVGHNLD